MEITELIEKVKEWAQERGLYEKGDPITQLAKLTEENGELARGLLKEDMDKIVDSIGDSLVVLINLTELVNRKYPEYCGGELTLEFCLSEAYGEIKDRKGSMKNGTFEKE
jgi:NTP pyrophosphatase (non-canonical NTP hydrolase)